MEQMQKESLIQIFNYIFEYLDEVDEIMQYIECGNCPFAHLCRQDVSEGVKDKDFKCSSLMMRALMKERANATNL